MMLRLTLRASLVCLFVAAQTRAAEPPAHAWTPTLLHDANAWPHSENDAHIAVTARGLRLEVASGREFAIAAASQLALPKELGRIRVSVAEMGGGAEWFVRLYGALRQPGDRRTLAVAQDETVTGERVFDLDPRARTQPDAPLQLQLGAWGSAPSTASPWTAACS